MSIVFLLFIFSYFFLQNRKYNENIREIQQQGLADLIAKGMALVNDKDIVLKAVVSDNGYETIRKLLVTNVRVDPEIIYGVFFRSYDKAVRAWVSPYNPEGHVFNDDLEVLPVLINKEIELDERGQAIMSNNTSAWALRLKKPEYRTKKLNGEVIYEFAAPIFEQLEEDGFEEEEEEEEKAEKDGPQLAGMIIYRLSPQKMNERIDHAEAEFKKDQRTTLTIMGIMGLLALGIGFIVTQRQAATITRPLGELTSAAEKISNGNYSIAVTVDSGDEVQTLASSFNQMVKDLEKSYSDLRMRNRQLEEARNELEHLNRHLEVKVEDRTKQLAESESKFRTLFEESADAILVGSEDAFLDCNPALLHMMGCDSKSEFLAMELKDISPELQPDGRVSLHTLQEYLRLARSDGSRQFEWLNQRRDGTEFFTEIVITSFPLGGKQVLHMVFRDITERKETESELKVTQQKLVETAHSAGMAEIATGVLHNIGNILNSVNISTEEISGTLKSSKIKGFLKANDLVNTNLDTISAFLTEHPKGKLIPGYYISLGDAIKEEHQIMSEEILALSEKVSMMRDVISTQQNYAKATLYTEDVLITELVEDALKLQLAALKKQGVRLRKEYRYQPRGMVPKVKLVHVLTNLIKNGKEAMSNNERINKPQEMVISVDDNGNDEVRIVVADNGCGIRPENLEKIFNHGFTTKDTGHGFGLHTCANFMTEMGGSLVAESDGEGYGSRFVCCFPLQVRGTSQQPAHNLDSYMN